MVTQNVTLNGSSTFSAFGSTYSWDQRYIERVGFDNEGSSTEDTLNMTMTGDAWRIRRLAFGSQSETAPLNVNITDTNDGIERRIDWLQLGAFSEATVTLYTGRIRFMDTDVGGSLTLTMGAGNAGILNLWDLDRATVTLGSGSVNFIGLDDGINTVTAGSGWLGALEMGEGTNTFTDGSGGFGTIRAFGTTNTFTFNHGGDTVRMGDGNNNVTLNNANLDTLFASGNERITLKGDSRILLLKMDDGVNRLTSETGNIESIYAFNAQNTINLGLGGAQQITLSGSAAAQVISSDGFVGAVQIYAGDQVNVQASRITTGEGGAGYIQTSKGNDVITTGTGNVVHIDTYDGRDSVVVGTGGVGTVYTGIDNDTLNMTRGYVDFVDTGSGNDLVSTGRAGGNFIVLGDGDDTVSITGIGSTNGIIMEGRNGVDTIDLSRFTTGVTISLAQRGAAQELSAGNGFFAFNAFENVIGTARDDMITGFDDANRITGGRGKDTLAGGGGIDTFVFARTDGSDRITDFTVGEDVIDIAGTTKLGDITFTRSGANVELSVGTLRILIEDVTVAEMRNAANFDF